ncbi:BRO-N domain-containing protein [Pseudovibrio ascidiaceicola]|uniref:BRO-N domain-containing protein n=1 Tax=Pseudovibrio ascidiaceicola TaxID=285279 RepID=UPI003D35DD8F
MLSGNSETMNAELSTFNFGELQVRVVMKDGEPWFVAVDVARGLELSVSKGMTNHLRPLDDNEKGKVTRAITPNLFQGGRGPSAVMIISESGLYKLIMRSDKPEAKRFQNWVTQEVLPSIRKTGTYISIHALTASNNTPPTAIKRAPSTPTSAAQLFSMMGQQKP